VLPPDPDVAAEVLCLAEAILKVEVDDDSRCRIRQREGPDRLAPP
jgi:hypothetical protein